MHHHLHILSPQTPFPLQLQCSLVINHDNKTQVIFSSHHLLPFLQTHPPHHSYCELNTTPPLQQRRRTRRRTSGSNRNKWLVSATERESKFEVDTEKARQALDELDEQLESLSRKQVNPPKIRATSLSNMKEQMKEESSEISGSFLALTAFGLFAFSIFYNILFLTVIKPSIDGPEEIVASSVTTTTIEAPNESLQNQ